MPPSTQVSHIWQDRDAFEAYSTAVSLHSHTSFSQETLSFIHTMCTSLPLVGLVVERCARASERRHGLKLDFRAAHWRPPLLPLMAYETERGQIARRGLEALVSLTDHDDIQAPLLLRMLPVARGIPVSVEWSVPFGATEFHLGIHNLPSIDGPAWMERFRQFTAGPGDTRLHEMLRELNAIGQVLIVFNHPVWDLYKIGDGPHMQEVERFLQSNNGLVHALELNGLRHARENGRVMALARRWQQTLISGGDRHGLEANACINLTNARNFTAFVQEIRVERRSHVLFMEQYAKPWEQRILHSTIEAVCDHPEFSVGWQRWDERAFHADADGVMRPLAELWPKGHAPWVLMLAVRTVRLFGYRPLGGVLRWLFGRDTTSEGDAAVREAA